MNALENDTTEDIMEMIDKTYKEIIKYQQEIETCEDFLKEAKEELNSRKY